MAFGLGLLGRVAKVCVGTYEASGPVPTLTLADVFFERWGISNKSGYRTRLSPVGSWLTDTDIKMFPKAPAGKTLVENSGGGGKTVSGTDRGTMFPLSGAWLSIVIWTGSQSSSGMLADSIISISGWFNCSILSAFDGRSVVVMLTSNNFFSCSVKLTLPFNLAFRRWRFRLRFLPHRHNVQIMVNVTEKNVATPPATRPEIKQENKELASLKYQK